MSSTSKTPADLMFDSWMLGLEMATVIWLRSWRMMGGGALAERESRRMVSEKVAAGMSFWPAMMMGGMPDSPEALGARALAHYSKPVRANRRRLARNG